MPVSPGCTWIIRLFRRLSHRGLAISHYEVCLTPDEAVMLPALVRAIVRTMTERLGRSPCPQLNRGLLKGRPLDFAARLRACRRS